MLKFKRDVDDKLFPITVIPSALTGVMVGGLAGFIIAHILIAIVSIFVL